MPARTRQFIPFVQGARSRFTYDEKFFCYAKIASLCYIRIRPGASHYFPGHSEISLISLMIGLLVNIDWNVSFVCVVLYNL